MSQENVEVVRQAWEAFARRDNESIFQFYDPEVELCVGLAGGAYHGLAGVRDFFHDLLDALGELHSEVEEFIDAGDHVIAVMHQSALGKRSRVPVEMRNVHVWTLRNGKLWRLRVYYTKTEALEAVGLPQ